MTTLLAIVIGCLYAAAVYLILRRSLFRLILGLVLLSHAANLLILSASAISARPPIASLDKAARDIPPADPLPQALILTAIVISFGVLAFALVLLHKTYQELGTDDSDELRKSDQ